MGPGMSRALPGGTAAMRNHPGTNGKYSGHHIARSTAGSICRRRTGALNRCHGRGARRRRRLSVRPVEGRRSASRSPLQPTARLTRGPPALPSSNQECLVGHLSRLRHDCPDTDAGEDDRFKSSHWTTAAGKTRLTDSTNASSPRRKPDLEGGCRSCGTVGRAEDSHGRSWGSLVATRR